MVFEFSPNDREEDIVRIVQSQPEALIVNVFVKTMIAWNRRAVAKIVRIGGGTEHDLQSVLHDAALELLQIILQGEFDPKRGHLNALFYAIAKNKWLDEIKRRYPTTRREIELNENFHYHGHIRLSPIEMDLFNQEDRDRIKKALEELDPECRELFMKKFYEGETLRTIAENSNSTEDALKQKHKRCKEKLRRLLNKDPRTE